MVLKIENSVLNDNSELTAKTPVQKELKKVVVPVGQKIENNNTDIETPVKGYYIEKNGTNTR